MQNEDKLIKLDTKESLKIEKNSKGYNWEIKLLSDEVNEDTVKRIEKIDGFMKERFSLGASYE